MLRSDNSPDATWVGNFLSHSRGVYFQARKSKGNGSGNVANNWRTNPPQKEMWLRIVKKDVTIEFYTAPDGHVAEAQFDGYEIDEYLFPTAAPSVSSASTVYDPVEEIRTQRAGTYQAAADGTETFRASGTDLWGRTDSFYFHKRQRPVAGDFTVAAYVADFPNWQANSRGGLMVRASLDPDAANAFVGAAGYRQGAVFQSRAAAGEETVHHKMVWANNENRFYVRLEKRGSALTASFRVGEADAWTVLGTTDLTFAGDTLYVGRAVTAGTD